MSIAADNKQLIRQVFAELASGSPRPFLDALADDVCWTIRGTTKWSCTFVGKKAVVDELLRPLNRGSLPR